MTSILMVCLGNICRSPLAEGILKSKLPKDKFTIDSAGTAEYHVGKLPDSRSIAVSKTHNINISDQRGRQFKVSDFDTFDCIYVMDNSNYKNVVTLARDHNDVKKVKLILDELKTKKNLEVPDPYYGGSQGFENVYQMLDKACDNIANQLN